MTTAARAGVKQRGRPFKKGRSGNPSGRPAGSRNNATLMAERLLQNDIEDVCRAVVTAAKNGDMTAAKIIIERLVPPRKDRPVTFALPKLETADDAAKALASIAQAVAGGELTPLEGRDIAALIGSYSKVAVDKSLAETSLIDTTSLEFARRVAFLLVRADVKVTETTNEEVQ